MNIQTSGNIMVNEKDWENFRTRNKKQWFFQNIRWELIHTTGTEGENIVIHPVTQNSKTTQTEAIRKTINVLEKFLKKQNPQLSINVQNNELHIHAFG